MARCNKAEAKDESFYHATKPIPSLSGYRVDRVGNVYSCLKIGGDDHAAFVITPYWRLLKKKLSKCGYSVVFTRSPDGKHRNRRISRLVLEAWIGPCPDGQQACHNDGNKLNDSLDNLRWDTLSGNQRDRLKHGTSNRGIHGKRKYKLTKEDVLEIRRLRSSGVSRLQVAAQFNIDEGHVTRITKGHFWGYMNDDGMVVA